MKQIYACIDLKSFYASVECCERKLNPLTTNLVVADQTRTEKTICLAITPSLKQYGLSGRARLFEVIQTVKEINQKRKKKVGKLKRKSYFDEEIQKDDTLELDYIIAPPRMSLYMKYSQRIYQIYLKFISEEDLFVYSIDEIFCNITPYLKNTKKTKEEFITSMIQAIYQETGITATAGIGTNLYLAKIAMDIVAKKAPPNEYGVRLASLTEASYRQILWDHKPLTDFWRIGTGIAKRLEKSGLHTMKDIAMASLERENDLFKIFGINAELIIDHAWGWEPCSIKDIKNYHPKQHSISTSQVLKEPYNYEHTKLIVKEMIELLSLDLVQKNILTNQITLTIGYDKINMEKESIREHYVSEVTKDHYGREIPKHAHGTIHLDYSTSSTREIEEKTLELFNQIINPHLWVRRIHITASSIQLENKRKTEYKQLDLFTNIEEYEQKRIKNQSEKKVQQAILKIKQKYGKNAILKAMNLKEGGTTIERNKQIGGHKE